MNDNNRRLFFTIALCLAVAYLWSLFFQPKHPAGPERPTAVQTQAPKAEEPPGHPGVPRGTSTTSPGVAQTPPSGQPLLASPRLPTRKVVLESEKLRLVITSDGAALESAQLKGDKFRRSGGGAQQQSSGQVDLVATSVRPWPAATELRRADGGDILLPADASYELVRSDSASATFRVTLGAASIVKTFSLDPSAYRLDLKIEVLSNELLSGTLAVFATGHGEASSGGLFSARAQPVQTICQAGGKIERTAVGAKHRVWDGPGPATLVGIDEQYFLDALIPAGGEGGACRTEVSDGGALSSALLLKVGSTANAPAILRVTQFLGPKDTDELGAVAPVLKEAVDFGFWSVIANFLLAVMKFFYKVVPPHNWGIAIILLTVSVKVVTFPLQHRSMKSMQEMQRIQPQLEEIKRKFAGDAQRQNLEQMKLFKEHGVNPMGSCLPMLIQMPVWFALYTTLGVSVELYNSVFIPGWLNDLTARDPFFVLPVAMGITMILTQILTPAPVSNPSQKTVGYVMSGVFSLFMLNLPSGLTLYIFTNNILSIAQQMYLRRSLKVVPLPARPAA